MTVFHSILEFLDLIQKIINKSKIHNRKCMEAKLMYLWVIVLLHNKYNYHTIRVILQIKLFNKENINNKIKYTVNKIYFNVLYIKIKKNLYWKKVLE